MSERHEDSPTSARMQPDFLRCEYLNNPLGIDVPEPRLSWQVTSRQRGAVQAAYQIRVAESVDALTTAGDLLWDTGKVLTDASIHQPYRGPALRSEQRCYWQVRVWDSDDLPSSWSEPAFWEMGLLNPSDWQAEWIQPDLEEDPRSSNPCPMLRTTFHVEGEIKSARTYATSLGLYEIEINGQRVSDQVFTPGWTSYHHRLQYQTFDVSDLLVAGENAIGVTLGDGWYRGQHGFSLKRNNYGDKLALLLQLHIFYKDGRAQIVGTNDSWKAITGPILKSDFFDGETYDARLEKRGWSEAGYDDSDWSCVAIIDHSEGMLVAQAGPPVRKIEEIKPIEIIHTPAGETVFDMGQNMAGRVRLVVQAPAGTVVTLRHAEVLDHEGNFYMKNLGVEILGIKTLGRPRQTVQYTVKGEGEEIYEPHFTFHGFRYVAVDGYPGEPTLDSLTGIVLHSDLSPTGHFECSHPLINQLQHNIVWAQKSNFIEIPTDCPQRERAGWTGDIQIYARTASFNMDVAAFLAKWLKDLALEQWEDGSIPIVVPLTKAYSTGLMKRLHGSVGWGDAATVVPWMLYLHYGDTRVLEEQYESMAAWVGYLERRATRIALKWLLNPANWFANRKRERQRYVLNTGWHWGDWLAPGVGPAKNLFSNLINAPALVATAFFAYSTGLMRQIARILGKTADAERYTTLHEKVKAAFCAEFVREDGRIKPDKQFAYVLALAFDLLPEELRPKAARYLAENVRKHDNHLTTGFVSTPYLCHVLSKYGQTDVAYDLLNQETPPSWLYQVKHGATTIWERWDVIRPDGSIKRSGTDSLNHYAFGAIGDWLYRVVAGLEVTPDAPGFKHTLIQPQPGGSLTHARATFNSMYGEIESAWEWTEKGEFRLSVNIPANTSATVRLPGATTAQVTENGQALSEAEGIIRTHQEEAATVVEVGSGQYEFVYTFFSTP